MFGYIINFLRSLNSNSKPGQIASSFCIGIILGFMPKDNLLWFMLFVFFAFVRINKAGYYIMIALASCVAFLLDPLFDTVGYWFLNLEFLNGFFAWLLDVPFMGFTRFNNSVVAGSLICGLVLFVPLYFAFIFGIKAWRKTVAPKFRESPILKTIYQIPLVAKISEKISEVM